MKLYTQKEAIETLTGILAANPSRLLAEELAKAAIKYADIKTGWTIKSLDISILKQDDKFNLKIGGEE